MERGRCGSSVSRCAGSARSEMCGIAGIVHSDGREADPALVERMCAAIEHRGPDARGIHAEGPAGLGIQRLRVVDLEGGDQPIYNEDRSVAVVLNGEIYNFRELRRRLEASGHRFRSDGDTEVIVHLYEEEGVDCVRSLDGMFAFALWDEPRRRLLVARDRVGKKPLFYSLRGGALSFASELRALLEDEEVPRDLDEAALDCYLAYGYVPAPLSAFAAVRKLPPATTMVYEGGRVALERYWQLDYSRKHAVSDPRELHEPLLEQLREATRRRHVTVALNGDGGDESFAGYTRYAANALAGRLERIPAPLRRAASSLAGRLPEGGEEQSARNRLRRLGGSLGLEGPARYERYVSLFDAEQRAWLYSDEHRLALGEGGIAAEAIAEPWREASGHDRLDVLLEVDVRTYLPGDLLTKIDIATMAHSLEARSPFLDPALMQFAASIPA